MRRRSAELLLTSPPLTEEQEHIDLIRKASEEDNVAQYPLLKWLFHIPNGGWRAIKTALKFKLMGVKPGVLDLFLPVMRLAPSGEVYGGLWIELKRTTQDAKPSAHQLEWIRYLRGAGYAVAVCKGSAVAWRMLTWYLDLPPYLNHESS